MTQTPLFALIIPAHNEEAVIARCLATAQKGAPSADCFEIIVAANGCTDNTVEIAKRAAPGAVVLDLAHGSKTAAINAANEVASYFPRIYLDADIECSFKSLAAMADELAKPDIMIVAPAIRLSLDHCNWFIKTYYSAWMKQPFAKKGKGGAGCYGLSKAALETVGEFPAIIGDDVWIHSRFPDHQRRVVSQTSEGQPVYTTVRPPGTAWQQVRVEARRMIGNSEVKRHYPSPHLQASGQDGGLRGSLKSGASPVELAVFYGVKLMVRVKMRLDRKRGNSSTWTRDLTSRQAQAD